MGAIRADERMKTTGLYMLQPYDPDRIPLIFVHGLISTPRMWRNVINELETDPVLRRRYQCWVFAYPTGNPPLYSALRLREELAKVPSAPSGLEGHGARRPQHGRHPHPHAGHHHRSRRLGCHRQGQGRAVLQKRQTRRPHRPLHHFQANPHVDRAIFICTPHRGSKMAVGTLGELAIRLISLPVDIVSTATTSLGSSISIITGDPGRMPTSIDGLSPRNPTFKVLDSRPSKRRTTRSSATAARATRPTAPTAWWNTGVPISSPRSPRKSSPARTARANCPRPSTNSAASSTCISNPTDINEQQHEIRETPSAPSPSHPASPHFSACSPMGERSARNPTGAQFLDQVYVAPEYRGKTASQEFSKVYFAPVGRRQPQPPGLVGIAERGHPAPA
jgi:hypothetical protein